MTAGSGIGPNNNGLQFQPYAGQILICDFQTGFMPPEMVKVRPVVVVSPQPRVANKMCMVVPLSSTAPNPAQPYHYRLPDGIYPVPGVELWAKCDMLYTVGCRRLDRVKVGFRHYAAPIIPAADLLAIRRCILHAIGLHGLTEHLG